MIQIRVHKNGPIVGQKSIVTTGVDTPFEIQLNDLDLSGFDEANNIYSTIFYRYSPFDDKVALPSSAASSTESISYKNRIRDYNGYWEVGKLFKLTVYPMNDANIYGGATKASKVTYIKVIPKGFITLAKAYSDPMVITNYYWPDGSVGALTIQELTSMIILLLVMPTIRIR